MKMSLQEHVMRIEHLTGDRGRVWKDRESVRGNLGAGIDQLKVTHAKETEQFKTTLEEVMAAQEIRHMIVTLVVSHAEYTPSRT